MGLGRLLITAGVLLAFVGLLVVASGKLNLPFGRLPGDITWRNGNSTVYIPIVTSLLLSLIGSLLLWVVNRR